MPSSCSLPNFVLFITELCPSAGVVLPGTPLLGGCRGQVGACLRANRNRTEIRSGLPWYVSLCWSWLVCWLALRSGRANKRTSEHFGGTSSRRPMPLGRSASLLAGPRRPQLGRNRGGLLF